MRWVVGAPERAEPGDRVLALTLDEERYALARGAEVTRFHELGEVDRADGVLVQPPRWRGYGFVELLEWLVCARLAAPGSSTVSWFAHRRGGATGVRRILSARGWSLDEDRSRGTRRFTGTPPSPGAQPEPNSYTTELGGRQLTFACDWGAFSADHVDAGTRLLFDTVSAEEGVDVVCDVGTGCGVLGVGLVAAGIAGQAVASEVDLVASALAARNAEEADTPVSVVVTDDPASLAATPLSVSHLPTHVDAKTTQTLVTGLCRRAQDGRVLVVVHAGLERRYVTLFEDAGAQTTVRARTSHVVLAVEGP